jgi:predicted metal-dependent HD superfamily phosphohydrolase
MGNKSSRIVTPLIIPLPESTCLVDAQTNTDFSSNREIQETQTIRIATLQEELISSNRQLRDVSASYENEIDVRQGKIVVLRDKIKRQKVVHSAKVYQLEQQLAGIPSI